MSTLFPFKGRSVDEGQRVNVYRNLHRKLFTIKCPKTNRVLAHGTDFSLLHAKPRIQRSGKMKAREQGVRSPHAYLQGYYQSTPMTALEQVITYDPINDSHFMINGEHPMVAARNVSFREGYAHLAIADRGVSLPADRNHSDRRV